MKEIVPHSHATDQENSMAEARPETLNDLELESYARNFLGEELTELSQEEIGAQLLPLLTELSRRDLDGFSLFSFALPERVTAEEIQSGNSSWAKVYKALFSLSKTEEYRHNPQLQKMVYGLENVIDQNPQMIGAVALWQTAKDILWRKDIPSHAKGSLMGSMTYALAFFDTTEYEAELVKNLDLEHTGNYAEVAHMLEAIKQFWTAGHEAYAEDSVPAFYLQALQKIRETPGSNYLLSMRAREILSLLERSDEFPDESMDLQPFELSRGNYASTQVDETLMIIPEENTAQTQEAVEEFNLNEDEIYDSVNAGRSVPPELMGVRRRLFNEMHRHATISIDEVLGDIRTLNPEERQELLFDYEYLVSRPVRELVQREFNFELKDLSIREQFFFLNYLKRVTVAEAGEMKEFTSTHGVSGMRTFLSLERGGQNLGDAIVAFGNQHEDIAYRIFEYYGELLESADKAGALVREVTDCEKDSCVELTNQVRENILKRAQKDLETAVKEPAKIAANIETYIANAKEYVALLQEVGQGHIETHSGSEITPEDQEEMEDLLIKNYQRMYPDNPAFRDVVFDSLQSKFGSTETTFRILRDTSDEKKIVSFDRFDTFRDANGTELTYFGSFNADPAYNGVGSIMLEETIRERLRDGRPMMAHCDPQQAITKKYIEDGFVATVYGDVSDVPSFEIWRSVDSDADLKSKQLSIVELFSLAAKTSSLIVREQRPTETYDEFKTGMALTRYFVHEEKTYLAFEQLPVNLAETFKVTT